MNAKLQFDTVINGTTFYPNLAKSVSLNTVFIPSNDVVPLVDSHIGAIHHTACTNMGPLTCHSISAMVCDLLLRCGDNQDGGRLRGCKDEAFDATLSFDVDKLEDYVQ